MFSTENQPFDIFLCLLSILAGHGTRREGRPGCRTLYVLTIFPYQRWRAPWQPWLQEALNTETSQCIIDIIHDNIKSIMPYCDRCYWGPLPILARGRRMSKKKGFHFSVSTPHPSVIASVDGSLRWWQLLLAAGVNSFTTKSSSKALHVQNIDPRP